MNKSRIAALVILVVLVAAAGILGLRSWVGIEAGEDLADGGSSASPSTSAGSQGQDEDSSTPTPSASPSASASPSSGDEEDDEDARKERAEDRDESSRGPSGERGGDQLASPRGIASDIESRLNRSGPRTSVSCPQAISSAVGTSFTCSVAYAHAPHQTVADARVNIVGSGLRYVWRSVPR